MARQESFNAYVGRELKNNAFKIGRVTDNMARVKGELKLVSKYASMVATCLLYTSPSPRDRG